MALPRLKVLNGNLCNDKGNPVMLRGMSTHGIQWYPQFCNQGAFQHLKDDWHTNVIRVAMYVEEGGFTDDGKRLGKNYAKMIECIDAAIAVGLYVIVDWHVSNTDQTPIKHQADALDFFQTVAGKYRDVPNVLYEICNEPNNAGNDYGSQIADYATACIKVIRDYSPNAIVIIGSGDWSKNCVQAWNWDKDHGNDRTNCMYTLHQYCDGHFGDWSPAIEKARLAGCPIFATEAGVSDSSEKNWGTQEEYKKIISFYEAWHIPYCAWSLCDKPEPSAVLNPGARTDGQWSDDQVSAAGHLTRDLFWKGAAKDPTPAPDPIPDPVPAPVPANAVILGKKYGCDLSCGADGKLAVTFRE